MKRISIFIIAIMLCCAAYADVSFNGERTAKVDADGATIFKSKAQVLTTNSTTTPLLGDASFVGEWANILDCAVLIVSLTTDQDSAVDGLKVEFSTDGTDAGIVSDDVYTVNANTKKTFSFQPSANYMKVSYVNGATDQTSFNLQTICKGSYVKPSSHRIADSIINDDDAELVKAVITGEGDDGTFRNANISISNRLATVSQPYGYAVSEGDISGHTALLKFGTRTSTSANTSSTLWEGSTDLYPYMSTAQQLKVSSTDADDIATTGTGARTLTLIGLDANYDEITETINMNGLTTVTTSLSFLRIFRAYVDTCGTSRTNEGTISIKNNAETATQALINIGDSQTLMTLWTVPRGATFYITAGSFSTDSNKGARVSLFTRILNGGILYPWRIRYRAFVFSGNENFPFAIPFKLEEKTDVEVRVLTPGSAGTTSVGSTFEGWYEQS